MVSTSATDPSTRKNLTIPASSSSSINPLRNKASKTNNTKTKFAKRSKSSQPSQSDDYDTGSSSGGGITTLDGAASDVLGDGGSADGGSVDGGSADGSSSGGAVSPLLQGEMSFEELVGEICNGIDLIFAVKRSTVVVTDYESIYAEAMYLRDQKSKSIQGEDVALWQIEEGTYELDVAEYGFYNTVKVHYKGGTVKESYEDLVRVYGEVVIEYDDKNIDKRTAEMKAKAYLAAHVRDFEMSVKANLLWDGNIDIGDIVTIENPLTMRDEYRVKQEKRDPEYYFVMGKSIEWEGETPITGTLELRYGAASPEKKDVPESGTAYSKSSSGNVDAAIEEVGQMASKISYSGACQTHDCVQSQKTGDCFGMSDFIACELKSRGVEAKIKGYPTFVPEHRSVLYKDSSGQWQRFPYRQYNVATLFRDTDGVNNGHDVNTTC